jgi:competence protein CoiA
MQAVSLRPDPDSAGCDGLADGWARRLSNNEPVHASQATLAEGPFYCAECHAEVTFRRGAERAGHFAHKAVRSSHPSSAESELHRACKQEIRAKLAAELPDGRWEVERTIAAAADRNIAEVRPDVSGRVRGIALAIEVQASALSTEAIVQRTRAYAQRRIPVLWVVPIPEQLESDGLHPRLYERYFHSLYLGRTYYWWPGMGASVLPVHYGSVSRQVPQASWYRPGGARVQVGGYQTTYRALKTPLCAPRLQISQDFSSRWRRPFTPENQRKAVPACQLWLDRLTPWW